MENLQKQVSDQQYKFAEVKQKLEFLKSEEKKIDHDIKQCEETIDLLNKDFLELSTNLPKMKNRVKQTQQNLIDEQNSRNSLQMTQASVMEKKMELEKTIEETKEELAQKLKTTEKQFAINEEFFDNKDCVWMVKDLFNAV